MTSLITPADRIFVAGNRGMAGSAICRSLLKYKYCDPSVGGSLLRPSRAELDLLNTSSVNAWYEKNRPDVVILAAAKVGGIVANSTLPYDFLSQNLKIQSNVIEGAWKYGARRLLFLASSCIYPKHSPQPIKEECLLTAPLEPTNEWYAIAKIAGIKLCDSLRRQYDFDAFSIMPTNLYGPGDNYSYSHSHVLPALIRRFYEAESNQSSEVVCWGTGSPYREFLHVDDLGEAVVFCLKNWKFPINLSRNHQPIFTPTYINVGTGKDIRIKDLAHKVAEYLGYSGKIIWDNTKPDGTPKKLLDITRISQLGWKAKINLEDGLKKVCEDYDPSKARL